MKNLNQLNTFLLVFFGIFLIASIVVYEKKLDALNEKNEKIANHSNERFLYLESDFNQKIDELNSKINLVDDQLTNLEAFAKGDYINQKKDLGKFREYTDFIGDTENLKYKLKTKFINNAVHFVFSIEHEENSDLSSLQKFILEFLDKDGFTVIKQNVYVHEMTDLISGNEYIFSNKFDANKEAYLLIDDAKVAWTTWK